MMRMQNAIIHLVATPVTAILDTVEMEGIVQVCAGKDFTLNFISTIIQISMNVRLQMEVYCVMRMLTAMILKEVMNVFVRRGFQETDSTALVCCGEMYNLCLMFFSF